MDALRGKVGAGMVLFAILISAIVFSNQAYALDGKALFTSRCIGCHGDKGDGKGLIGIVHRVEKSGMVWNVYPRDFTTGVFKFRSTPTGCLPSDSDLMNTITVGIPRSYMPSSKDLSDDERMALVQYIKTFSPRWKEEKACDSMKPGTPGYVGSASSVAAGEKTWNSMKCWECHGKEGKGDGPKSATLKDDWGDKVLPFDFTSGATKRGFDPKNIYLAYSTGLDGTGMPSYADSLSEEDRWNLVSYTLKLMGRVK